MREAVNKSWIEGRHKRLWNYRLISRFERHKIESILISSIEEGCRNQKRELSNFLEYTYSASLLIISSFKCMGIELGGDVKNM